MRPSGNNVVLYTSWNADQAVLNVASNATRSPLSGEAWYDASAADSSASSAGMSASYLARPAAVPAAACMATSIRTLISCWCTLARYIPGSAPSR